MDTGFSGLTNYQDLLEAGSILEDAQWPHPDYWPDKADQAHGRFTNHFYDPQGGGGDAVDWAYNSANQYDYTDAMKYFAKGFSEPTKAERRKYQAKMFVSVGQMMHMLNDMDVPAHVRSDLHGFDEPFEKYMKGGEEHNQPIGFYVLGNTIQGNLKDVSSSGSRVYENFQFYMTIEAEYTSTHFVSEDSMWSLRSPISYKHPNKNDITVEPVGDLGFGIQKSYYVSKMSGNSGVKLGIKIDSYIVHVTEAMYLDSNTKFSNLYQAMTAVFDGDNSVLIENGQNLLPRAIANASGFVNYFFRGRIKSELTKCGLEVTNKSNEGLVAAPSVVTFKAGGVFKVYADNPLNPEGNRVFLAEKALTEDMAVDDTLFISGIAAAYKSKLGEPTMEVPLTVVYTGNIGEEAGVAVSYGEHDLSKLNDDYTKQSGVVEVALTWSRPELNYDLQVEWDAGEVDVKDLCKPYEHFYIKSERQIYPGRYAVSALYHEESGEDINDSIFPFDVNVTIFTPKASDHFQLHVKSRADLNIGHVADIKVYRPKDKDPDSNSSSSSSSSEGGNQNPDAPTPLIFLPTVAPDCPPVTYTPSPTPRTPVYFHYSNGVGSWSLNGGGGGLSGGGGGWFGGNTGNGTVNTGGSAAPLQKDPACAGDVSCLPTAGNSTTANTNDYTKLPLIPVHPVAGGQPVRDLDEEDNCTGNYSCLCIPCEYEILPEMRKVYLGPLRNAPYQVYALGSYVDGNALYSGVTTNGETLYDAGDLDIPNALLETFDDDELYIIEVSGGEDIDANDDFIVDAIPTPNNGKAYAIASGADLKYTGLKVNILTTVAFTLVEDMVRSGATKEEINAMIAKLASRMLRYKVYPKQDEAISNVDLLAWLPTVDKDLLLHSYDPLEAMVQKIYAGEDIYDDAYNYLFFVPPPATAEPLPVDETIVDDTKPPIIKGISAKIDEDAAGGTVVGTIEILRGSDDVSFGALSGKGHEKFDVDANGTLWLREGESLDYETKWLYKLKVEAFNAKGGSGQVGVYVSVKNVLDAPEFESLEGGSIAEDATAGTVVGTLHYNEGLSPITSIELKGESAELFEVDTNGVIRLKESDTLDYEKLYSYGFVVLAYNAQGVSMPVILYINVQDMPDVPVFKDYTGGYIHEDALAGEFVGQVVFEQGGSNLTDIRLEGEGSENFSIDLNGTVSVADGAVLDYESIAVYRPLVVMSNSYGDTNKSIFVVLSDAKDVPSYVSFSGGNVKENSPVGTVVGTITYDEGASPIESVRLSGNGAQMFSVLNNGIIVVAQEGLNYEEKNSYTLTAIAQNHFGESLPLILHLFVDDVVETPPVLEDFVVNDVLDDATIGQVIGTINVLNVGSSKIERFEPDSNAFTVDNNGTVRVNKALNYAKQNVYNLKVRAKNGAGFGNNVNLIVRLVDHTQYAPTLHDIDVYFDKEIAIGSVVGNVLSSAGQASISEIVLSPDSPFGAKANGDIVLESSLETQMRYDLSAIAYNQYGDSNSVSVTLRVILPPDITPINTTVFDDSKSGTVISGINIVENGTEIRSVKLSGEGSEDFRVDYNRSITVAPGVVLDAQRQSRYDLKIVVNGIYEANAAIDVLDDIVGRLPLGDTTIGITASKDRNLNFVVVNNHISILDTTEVLNPLEISTINGVGYTSKVALSDDETKVYLPHAGGLSIAENSDPYAPYILGSVKDFGVANDAGVSADGTVAYVSTSNLGVKVIDVSDPENPIVSSTLNIMKAVDFERSPDGKILYVADYASGIYIVDISTPLSPHIISSLPNDFYLSAIALSKDGTRIITAEEKLIRVIDVENPYKPVVLSSLAVSGQVQNAAVSDANELALVASSDIGVHLVDISDPIEPTLLKTIKTDHMAWDVAFSSDPHYAYVADYDNGLPILDVQVSISEKRPRIIDTNITVEENTIAGLVVGRVKPWYIGNTGLSSFTLSGEGSEDFAIDLDGNVTLVNPLNYYARRFYELNATATNAQGSRSALLNIRVHSIPEVHDLNLTLNSSIMEGTKVGTLDMWIDDNTTLSDIQLTGSNAEYFSVNANGEIFVAEGVALHHFMIPEFILGVVATNQYGNSVEAALHIKVSASYSTSDVLPTQENNTTSFDGTKKFVVDGYNGLKVVDISDENATYLVNSIGGLGNAIDVTLSANRMQAYVLGNSGDTLFVVDVSDISNLTVLETIPLSGKGRNIRLSQDGTAAVIQDVYSEYIVIDAMGLNTPAKKPGLYGFDTVVNYDTAVGEVVGQVDIVYTGNSGLTSIALQGEQADDFSIDLNGTVTVAKPFDFRRGWVYELMAVGSNSIGSTNVPVNIILESTPIFVSTPLSVEEHAPAGTVLGSIEYWNGGYSIDTIALSGSGHENFSITTDGEVRVNDGALFNIDTQDTYSLYVSATNALGSGKTFPITIEIEGMKIDENISNGVVVGQIAFAQGQTITSVSLSGLGSEYFSIDTTGKITVVDADGIDFETAEQFELTVTTFNGLGESNSMDIQIDVRDVIDAPTLYDTTLNIDEHAPIGTIIGQMQISAKQDCAISSFRLNRTYGENLSFTMDTEGVVSVVDNQYDIDYEHGSGAYFNVTAISECGESNTALLRIDINDLDENAEVGFGIMPYGSVGIYRIEQNQSLTKRYEEYVSLNGDSAVFNTHKYELDSDAFYLFEVQGGDELDGNYDGVIDWSSRFTFNGTMRAIVKGSWLFDVERMRISPLSETVAESVIADGLDPSTLEARLNSTATALVKSDIDQNGEINALDALQYNAAYVTNPYIFAAGFSANINAGIETGSTLGTYQLFTFHDANVTSVALEGTYSNLFTLGADNTILTNGSLADHADETLELNVVATDADGNKSIGEVFLHVTPPMYLLSTFNLGGEVYKTDVDTDRSLLYVAAGGAGVVIQNVSDPYNTYTVAQYYDLNDGPIDIVSLALSPDKTKLYVLDVAQDRIIAFDVTEPTVYNYLGEVAFENASNLVVSPDGKYLYVHAGMEVQSVDVSDPTAPFISTSPQISAMNIALDNNQFVACEQYEEYYCNYYDVSDALNPQSVAGKSYHALNMYLTDDSSMKGYGVDGQSVVVADMGKRDAYDRPEIITSFETQGYNRHLSASSDYRYFYISNDTDGVQIVGFE